jgi:hypothetical protein
MARFKMPSLGRSTKSAAQAPHDPLRARPQRRDSKRVSVVLTQSGSRVAWWDVGDGLQITSSEPKPIAPDSGVALSFGTSDKELVLLAGSPPGVAKEFIEDVAEEVSHYKIRQGKPQKNHTGAWKGINSNCVYATPRVRFEGMSGALRVVPGVAALRALLAKTSSIESMQAPFVTGILFGGADQSTQVMILYLCTEEGELTKFDYMPITGDDPSAAIKLFVQSNRLSSSGEWDEERVAIFSGAEIESVVAKIGSYPQQQEFLGLGVDVLAKGSAVILGASLIGMGLYTGWLLYENADLKARQVQSAKLLKSEQAALKERLSGPRFGALIERKSVKVDEVFALANSVWKEGSTVRVVAKQGTTELTVVYAVKNKEISQEELAGVIRLSPPEGCERRAIESNLQMNELTVKYDCKKSDPYLRLLDGIPG